MTRVAPCEDPRSCPGVKRSMPSTRNLRRDSSQSVALPITPRPQTTTSKRAIVSGLPVVRVPVPLQIGDERRAEAAIGLIACVGGAIAAEKVERFLDDAEGATVADGTDGASVRQPIDQTVDGTVHIFWLGDLVADQAAIGAVAYQLSFILNGLARDPVAGEARQAQICQTRDDTLLPRRQRHERVARRQHVVHGQ